MPTSSNHFIYDNLLRIIIQHFTATSDFVQLCLLEIIYNMLIVPECVYSSFKCSLNVSKYNPVRQGFPHINHPINH